MASGALQCDGFSLVLRGFNVKRAILSDAQEKARPSGETSLQLFLAHVKASTKRLLRLECTAPVNWDATRAYCAPCADTASGSRQSEKRNKAVKKLKSGLTFDGSIEEGQGRDRLSEAGDRKVIGWKDSLTQRTLRGLPISIPRLVSGHKDAPIKNELDQWTICGDDPGEAFSQSFAIHHAPEDAKSGQRRVTSLLASPRGQQDITNQTLRRKAKARGLWMWQIGPEFSGGSMQEQRIAKVLHILMKSSSEYRKLNWWHQRRATGWMDRAAAQFLEASHARDGQKVLLAIGDNGDKRSGVKRGSAAMGNKLPTRIYTMAKERGYPLKCFRVNEAWTSQACSDPDCLRSPAEDWNPSDVPGQTAIRSM